MRQILLLCVLALASSCAIKTSPADATVSRELTPTLNTVNTADIGVNLVSSKIAFYYDAIKLNKDYKLGTGSHGRNLPVDVYVFKNSTKDYNLYANRAATKGIAVSKKDGSLRYFNQGGGIINIVPLKDNLEYTKTTSVDLDRSYFSQEFIYTGKSGNIANFLYREFNNDVASQEFFQELHFDLSQSKIIGCKGLRVEVINAGNVDIEYRVLQYFK